jgi:hypothetical protein
MFLETFRMSRPYLCLVIIGLQTFNVVCNIEEMVMKCHELYYECLTSVIDLCGYILIIYGYKKISQAISDDASLCCRWFNSFSRWETKTFTYIFYREYLIPDG